MGDIVYMIRFVDNPIGINEIIENAYASDPKSSYQGPMSITVENCSKPDDIGSNCIVWLRDEKCCSETFYDGLRNHSNLIIVCDSTVKECVRRNITNDYLGWIITDKPRDVFFHILDVYKYEKRHINCGKNTVIETDDIDKSVVIGNNCYIGPDVKIGNNVTIHNNVVIECPTVIGEYSTISSGVIIGSTGYGYHYFQGKKNQNPHFMGVVIGHHTDIGANTCIDRGCLDDTRIGNYVKVDNLVHIAHNVVIHDHVMVVAQAMLGGSSEYGEYTYVAPGARVFDSVKVGREVIIGVGAVVKSNVEDKKTVVGIPAHEIRRK